ncbi:MAG: anaerobic ribonucleoside-triphosphate reductase activating protein [Candidatus Portnoybacteria bacterium CG06_land_8_20_14_3_00_39_12]|uniref:Anaerobic ribonucleoside-triphosphate reductase activating protein n=3 Tax=Candidatus Portnoyibacteriota TaxID=1817913 RepID=A0A2M8KG13_9BACT|nr:MAG: anaerobic ribonucleoside-triphosphate reductase activating protein [Parcubacteria group bacterium CG1_02_40_25]PIU75268.1 MAG: anaerobic ribonucleoside-triphosphate reductase activating protein [Candidatus Portnoybacteria bacterium CG06_land_8_20_14_3_00_39_12]PIZ70338.1 MAG: anaerobic ribonucleoside-triphosphate reductase activating protein [Candidatus Portnoybacteria bacterium CG_4_10_14_0_2_um_filter_39_11]PJE58861.1 MAG: anaerobic ribonucleoside-triphosphate reductase activating prot
MLLGGLQKLSLIDYPGKLAAVVFTLGCNFRCGFCHNPELVLPALIKKQSRLAEADFFKFLRTRQGKIDGVVVTGGEPTLHQDLPDFISQIKKLGFLVKLDTNGSCPEMLRILLEQKLLDYIAMDIKSSPERYHRACGLTKINLSTIQKSIDFIKNSALPYNFRTTLAPNVVSEKDISQIRQWLGLAPYGAWLGETGVKLVLQEFRPEKTLAQYL